MAFPTGWTRRCPLTIDKTKVPSDLVSFPVVFTLANLPSEMFDADGTYPARADGGDIRFSSDQAGTIELPLEVYYFLRDNNPANGKAEIHVKVPAVSSSVNTVIYVWYNNPSATGYARNGAYGSDNVWDANFKFVCHNGATVNDSTSGALTGTNHSTTEDAANTLIGVSGRKFVAASSQYVDWGNTININGNVAITIEAVCKFNSAADGVYQFVLGRADVQYYIHKSWGSANVGIVIYDTTWRELTWSPMATGTWYHFAGRRTVAGTLVEFIVNGSLFGSTVTTTTIASSANFLTEGYNYSMAGRYLDGWIEETRISDSSRSNAWITATYKGLSSPGTFASAGSPESAGGARIFDFSPFFI